MPWQEETDPVERRKQFVQKALARSPHHPLSELCKLYRISRKTAYKWLGRAARDEGLEDRSRARHTQPHRTSDEVRSLLIEFRRAHPKYGPKTAVAILAARHPTLPWPAPSTAGDIFKQAGLIPPKAKGPKSVCKTPMEFAPVDGPNATWYADHKGDFALRNGERCYPGTISDGFSRKLLRCVALPSTESVLMRRVFHSAFDEFGLPQVIRTDNGNPFGNTIGGMQISALSVWFIELGIRHEFIQPGHPEQNGVHERMHRTLKAHTVVPPGCNMRDQQRRFDLFLPEFNKVRPHRSLGMKTPDSAYRPSLRKLPNEMPQPQYPAHAEIRRVSSAGTIAWGKVLFVSKALAGKHLACERITESLVRVDFFQTTIGMIDEEESHFIPNPDWHLGSAA